jgi:hypothetical protein
LPSFCRSCPDRNQKDKPHGVLFEWDNMTLWALEWSEIVANARAEMQLVRDHLKQKSAELTLSDYLRENFPEVLSSIRAKTSSPPQ